MNIWWKIGLSLLLLVGIAWGVNAFLNYEQNVGYQKAVAEYNIKLVAAQAKAAEDTAKLTKEKDDALAIAAQQLQDRDKRVAALTTQLSGLRNTVANLSGSLPTASITACRARAVALSTVFGQCSDRLRAMGQAAQGQLIDSMMYQKGWPK